MARKSLPPASEHTILVVDDQEETLISVRSLLEREGHRVLTADSGERASRILLEEDVHLLIVDYFMPRMTGEELIRDIRRFDPYVQIILQTGYAGRKPPRVMLAELDIQGYHDKGDGPERLLMWVEVGLKAFRLLRSIRERERLQGELVANVSHEFRTPLNVIGGYADLLMEGEFGELSPPIAMPVSRIVSATRNLTDMVEDFLKYAKLEAGVSSMVPQRIVTETLAEEFSRFVNTLVDSREIDFAVDLKHAPLAFTADQVKLCTILRNLLTNAVKFTERGTVSLTISAGADAGVRFAVRDTGPGISPADIEVIFEAFRQLDGSTSRRFGGVGLGLALSRKLAGLIGGTLEVESELGIGSVFTVSLPAVVEADEMPLLGPPPVALAVGS